ncbi:MAG: hypothetical protein ACYTDV_17590, partial [Planctomycetota bacterium]
PGDYLPRNKKREIRQVLDRIAKLQWGKSSKGLSLSVLVNHQSTNGSVVRIAGKPVDVKEKLEVIAFVRNDGEHAVNLLDYPVDRPVKLHVKDPKGKVVNTDIYPQYPKGKEPELQLHFIRTLKPGQVAVLKHLNVPVTSEIGIFEISATYENHRDAVGLNIGSVWKGKVASPTLNEKVPRKSP